MVPKGLRKRDSKVERERVTESLSFLFHFVARKILCIYKKSRERS